MSAAAGSSIPKLGFTFTAPEGFSLDNTAQAVIGVRDGGTQAMRFDVVRVPAEQSLGDYLTSGWIDDVDKATVEDLTINGFPAATATARGDQWRFRIYALRFGSDVYRFVFASKQKTGEGDRSFRETVNTFRRLTLAEIQAARPLRLKVDHRAARRHGRIAVAPHGRRRPSARALPRAQRPRCEEHRQGARSRQDRQRVVQHRYAAAAQPPAFSLRLVDAGCFARPPAGPASGRTGRRTSSPRQFGQRPLSTLVAQPSQNVHS